MCYCNWSPFLSHTCMNAEMQLVPQLDKKCVHRSVRSDSLWPCGLQLTRLLCPRDSPGNNTGVGCHIILSTELKLSCLLCNHQKKIKKIMFYMIKTKEYRLKRRHLSFPPPWESQTPISALRAPDPFLLIGTPDFYLPTYLGIDSLTRNDNKSDICW